jgi:hypothetical protein
VAPLKLKVGRRVGGDSFTIVGESPLVASLDDGWEVHVEGTDPTNPDTDEDGCDDAADSQPLNPDSC